MAEKNTCLWSFLKMMTDTSNRLNFIQFSGNINYW